MTNFAPPHSIDFTNLFWIGVQISIVGVILLALPYILSSVYIWIEGPKFANTPKERLNDLVGQEKLSELISEIKVAKYINHIPGALPEQPRKGVLLYGPPGCGKTLAAKVMAGELGMKIFEVTGSSFENRYIGVGSNAIGELFAQAKANAPCLVFIDEFDSLAQKRQYSESGSAEKASTLNKFLAEMDGFVKLEGVLVVAATNNIEFLDEAAVRPGRFDRKVEVKKLNKEDLQKLLQLHLNKLPEAQREEGLSTEVIFKHLSKEELNDLYTNVDK